MRFNYIAITGALFLSVPCIIMAEELATVWVIDENNNSTSTAKVTASKVSVGHTYIDQKALQNLPQGNGDINEVLKYLPGIKAEGNNVQSSENAGELEPENVSISGGAFYQNNFQIDNVSNNSLLDPANKSVYKDNDIKGHPQEMFIGTDMVESVNVYDSDVPTKYGGFTGGVVDIKTKHAAGKFGGQLSFRHTSDSMTEFFVNDVYDFEWSRNADKMQPKFDKNFFSFSLNTPIDESNVIYSSLSLKNSKIPILHLGGTKDEERNIVNYFVKYSKYFKNEDILDVTLSYAPYEEDRFRPDVKNSDFKVKGGGLKLYANHERETDDYTAETTLALSHTINSREAPANYYKWATSDTFDWGRTLGNLLSYEGGFGDIEKTQTLATLKSNIEFDDLFKVGFDIQKGMASFQRDEESSMYQVAINGGAPTNNGIVNLHCFGADGCVDGEQYANMKKTYHMFETDVDIWSGSSYIEKDFKWSNFDLRAGLRYDYNNYMSNHDISYRTLSSYDMFGDDSSILSIGLNRYYAKSFLAYKLREAVKPYVYYTRPLEGRIDAQGDQFVTPGEWEESSRRGRNKTRYSDLKTPYSDEISLGYTQELWGGKLIAKKIYRDSEDAFSRTWGEVEEDGYRYYTLTNDGSSTHERTQLSYQKQAGSHSFSLSLSDSKTTRTNLSYDKEVAEDIDSPIIYEAYYENGNKKYRQTTTQELSYDKETNPNIVKFLYNYKYSDALNLSIFATYKSKYMKHEVVGQKAYEYYDRHNDRYMWTDTSIYELVKHKPSTKVDVSMVYKYPLSNGNQIILKGDVKNLFNTRENLYAKNKFGLGRQIWVEVNYKF